MRNVPSEKNIKERPAICIAIDEAIEESNLRNRDIAKEMGMSLKSEMNIGRWRSYTEPDRSTLARLEVAIGKPKGYISRLAGFFEEVDQADLIALLNTTSLINDGYREILLRSLEEAIKGTIEEREEQSAWRKATAAKRRSRSR